MRPQIDADDLNRHVPCPSCDGHGTLSLSELLLRAVSRTTVTETGCWEYAGTRKYPTVYGRSLRLGVHQLAYRVWHGVPADQVLHICDNNRCWNPAHVYDGDSQQNNTDRRQRAEVYGRAGSANHFAKLTEEQVATILAAREEGGVLRRARARELAEQFGVSLATVYRVSTGHTWRKDTRVKPEPRQHWKKRGLALKGS